MTASGLRRFMRENAGRQVCIAYRTTLDGTIVLRPEPRPLGIVLVTLGLAACTGHTPDTEHPDESCRDASGYEIDCSSIRARDVMVVPDSIDAPSVKPVPHDPAELDSETDDQSTIDESTTPDHARMPTDAPEGLRSVPPTGPRSRPVEPDADRVRDRQSDYRFTGVLVVPSSPVRPRFVPTVEIFAELSERAAEQRVARALRREERAKRRALRER